MEKNTLSVDALEAFIEESLQMYVADESNTMITDIHLQLKPETGGLALLNDEDCVFSETIIEEWKGLENEDKNWNYYFLYFTDCGCIPPGSVCGKANFAGLRFGRGLRRSGFLSYLRQMRLG